jgi:hypothetical protein
MRRKIARLKIRRTGMKKLALAFLIVTSLSFAALADIAQPKVETPTPTRTPKNNSKKSIDTQLSIVLVNTDQAVLRIPKSQVQQLRAQLDAMDNGGDAATMAGAATTGGGISFGRLQTIASGGFLSLAVVFGGLWFSRSKKMKEGSSKAGKIAASLAILFLAGAATTAALANAGPPPEARSITGKMFTDAVHMYRSGSGAIKLEVADDKDNYIGVQLIVPDPNGFPKSDDDE